MDTIQINQAYSSLQKKSNEQGISSTTIFEIKNRFFSNISNQWQAHESFWKPTGIVLGFPFSNNLSQKIIALRDIVINESCLKNVNIWVLKQEFLHSTIISYSHYSERTNERKPINFPLEEISKAEKIINSHKSLSIIFRGILLTSDGSLLLKGHIKNEDLLNIRIRLKNEIEGITQHAPDIIHIKLAQILTELSPENVKKIN